jgi:hypothetical protein
LLKLILIGYSVSSPTNLPSIRRWLLVPLAWCVVTVAEISVQFRPVDGGFESLIAALWIGSPTQPSVAFPLPWCQGAIDSKARELAEDWITRGDQAIALDTPDIAAMVLPIALSPIVTAAEKTAALSIRHREDVCL